LVGNDCIPEPHVANFTSKQRKKTALFKKDGAIMRAPEGGDGEMKLQPNSICIRPSSRPFHITVVSIGAEGEPHKRKARRFSRTLESEAVDYAVSIATALRRPIYLATEAYLSPLSLEALATYERRRLSLLDQIPRQ
jgi:hypothetical protein